MGKMGKKVKYGNVDIPAEEFDRKNLKIRISMMMDADVLDAYKDAAKRTSHGEYQTLMKEILREGVSLEHKRLDVESRLDEMKKEMDELQRRTEAKFDEFEHRIQSVIPVQAFMRYG